MDRDVINLDASFGDEFFNVAVGEPGTQIPAYRQQDHIRRKPETHECRTIKR